MERFLKRLDAFAFKGHRVAYPYYFVEHVSGWDVVSRRVGLGTLAPRLKAQNALHVARDAIASLFSRMREERDEALVEAKRLHALSLRLRA